MNESTTKAVSKKGYKRILLAVELQEESDAQLVAHADMLAKAFNAELTVVHAAEYIPSYAAYGFVGADVEEMIIEDAEKKLTMLANQLAVKKDNQVLRIGPARAIILEEAERIKADLIIVGSHGRHGIRLILGSTANAVLHGAKCDVIAVRLSDD